jgi:hypothetical protein
MPMKLGYSSTTPTAPSTLDPPAAAPKPDKLADAIAELQRRIAASPPTRGFVPDFEELRGAIGHAGLPDKWLFDDLQRCLAHLLRVHWSVKDIQYFEAIARQHREDERHRQAVIDDHRRKLAQLNQLDPQGWLDAEKKQLEASIASLLAVGANAPIWDADFFGATKKYAPWALAIRDIGRRLLAVSRSADVNAGLPPRAAFDKNAIDFVIGKVPGRINDDENPSRDDIVRVLRKLETENQP